MQKYFLFALSLIFLSPLAVFASGDFSVDSGTGVVTVANDWNANSLILYCDSSSNAVARYSGNNDNTWTPLSNTFSQALDYSLCTTSEVTIVSVGMGGNAVNCLSSVLGSCNYNQSSTYTSTASAGFSITSAVFTAMLSIIGTSGLIIAGYLFAIGAFLYVMSLVKRNVC